MKFHVSFCFLSKEKQPRATWKETKLNRRKRHGAEIMGINEGQELAREEGDDGPLVKQRGSSRAHMSSPRPTTPRRAGITPCSKDYASNPWSIDH